METIFTKDTKDGYTVYRTKKNNKPHMFILKEGESNV